MADRFFISGAGFPVAQEKLQPQNHGFMNMYGDVSDFGGIPTFADTSPEAELAILEHPEPPVYPTTWLDTRTTEVTTKTDEDPGKYTTLVTEITLAEKSEWYHTVCKLFAHNSLKCGFNGILK
jgi:hypothetical protein